MTNWDGIERAMQRALATARPTIAQNFVHPDWAMSVDEFIAFWGGTRMASVSTVGDSRWPHAAPLEVSLVGDGFIVPTFAGSVRMADLQRNPRLVMTAWDDAWHAAIVYGRAQIPDATGGNVRVAVRPTRIYAMRAPRGHHAWREG